jgi:DNA-binding transcriptional ArsR family regulator
MSNRVHLEKLKQRFQEWLHIDDSQLLYTIAATKISHKIQGDPIWIMVVGPPSGGKTEYLRAFFQPGDIKVDDLTPNTFVSGYKSSATETLPQFATMLKDKIWYIFDLSILMSKHAQERSLILSDMRAVYDGHIKKEKGNRVVCEANCEHNTLICCTTPAIDNTILEDQLLGTRFITYRIPKQNRHAIMSIIDKNQDKLEIMRESLNIAVREFEKSLDLKYYNLTELDNQNLQLMSNMTTLLRTSVSYDKQGEASNLAYPEEPGRLYKQLKKLYCSYRMIGLTEEESLKCVRKICIDNVNPIRVRLIESMIHNTEDAEGLPRKHSTTNLHTITGLGKKTVKSHMSALRMLGLVHYSVEEEFGRITKENWRLFKSNLHLLFGDSDPFVVGKSLWPAIRRKQ